MKLNKLFVSCLSFLNVAFALDIVHAGSGDDRDSRKLFGGYKITPKFCKATRPPPQRADGPTICMFNHECSERNGQVVGACMDGFLFGACCQLPSGTIGELLDSNADPKRPPVTTGRPQTSPMLDITASGLSQITAALLNTGGMLPTAQENTVVQIGGGDVQHFSTTGVTHPQGPDTLLVSQSDNDINPIYFNPTKRPIMEDRKTTLRVEDHTVSYADTPLVHISISNGPSVYTQPPFPQRPMFKPKPVKPTNQDKYVLVPTLTHAASKPNKTQEYDSIVNILNMLNQTTTTAADKGSTKRPPTSQSYLYSVSSIRPNYEIEITTRKPPSTSYVFSTTIPPRRTEPTKPVRRTTTKQSNKKPTIPNKKTTQYFYGSTSYRPGHSTVANSPAAFVTTKKPPSTSYVYSPLPTRRPPGVINSHIVGPGFTVSSTPSQYSTSGGQQSSFASPPPTVIVLSPLPEEEVVTKQPTVQQSGIPTFQSSPRPGQPGQPLKKPINHVTINNHITQNIYSSSERPLPTVLITPKPSLSSSTRPGDYDSELVEAETSVNDLNNFPPVRNPNLNMSNPSLDDNDFTTPAFIEDDALNDKVESFVNKIIQGLQEPFEGLKDIVYNRNKTAAAAGLTSTTTKKPIKKQGTTTKRPPKPSTSNARPATSTPKPTTKRPTTRRPSTNQSSAITSTRRPQTTTKKSKTTRKPTSPPTTTSTESFIEEDNSASENDYRNQCGVRPLIKTGRIVGGKGASFGEFPWQVLVRESTWLGLFTKNKCGGVLISNKYVMTAAHCQPGFLASLVAVFGEFDISGDLESKRHISRNVKRVIVHRQYDAATFANDLALLELEAPVQFDAHIVPICLPREGEDFTGRMATVTGWGRLKYGGGVPSVLQEVQVPIMENHVCQEMFRTAGHSKVILESFLCAGYANGQKDSCEGDSGGPLVLQRPDGRYQLAGTVSHGIKCAAPYLPGVYMRTTFYKPWITSVTAIN